MKKKLLALLLAIAGFATGISARSNTDSSAAVFTPEKRPEFKNGLNGWARFLEKNLDIEFFQNHPAPKGKYTVIASFLVETDGAVKDIRIEQDPGFGTADEMKRVLKLSNKLWIPAFDKGIPVAYRHRQSLTLVN